MNEKTFISRRLTRRRSQPILLACIASALFAVPVHAQIATDSAPHSESTERIPVDVFKGPSIKKFGFSDCREDMVSAGSRLAGGKCDAYPSVNTEGWVVLNFMVDASGKPFEVAVTQSTGSKQLESVATRTLERTTFEPGTVNGKPIESTLVMKFKFANGPSTGPQPDFIKAYKLLQEAIKSGDRAAADAALKELTISNPYEDAYFGVATFSYAVKWGTRAEQLAGLKRAIANETVAYYLPAALFRTVLLTCFRLELQDREYAEAITIWKILQKAGLDAKTAASLKPVVDQLEKIRSDNNAYEVTGAISETSWYLLLFKRHFRAVISEGHISEVKLRCDTRFLHFAFDPTLQYEVSSKDGECFLELDGAPGTQFKLIQF
ncbi:MAG TPA: TonB family protein [Steroidobacteraceae bacterium]|nr:TonB family protein [Steroidobacteraceae bacterium]